MGKNWKLKMDKKLKWTKWTKLENWKMDKNWTLKIEKWTRLKNEKWTKVEKWTKSKNWKLKNWTKNVKFHLFLCQKKAHLTSRDLSYLFWFLKLMSHHWTKIGFPSPLLKEKHNFLLTKDQEFLFSFLTESWILYKISSSW